MVAFGFPSDDTIVAIYWTRRDMLVALAGRLPEFDGSDTFDLLGRELTPSAVGVTEAEVQEIEASVSGVLEEMSITWGWQILEDSLDYLLGLSSVRLAADEHPNSLR
jgi:hypothetical protein